MAEFPNNSLVVPRGAGVKEGGAVPKVRILCPKTALFVQKLP